MHFDVVLVDATMPQMDGFAFLETAEREQLLRTAKIIMLDRGRPPRIDQKALHVDIAADLHKPISRVELGEAIAQVLGAAPDRRGPAKTVTPAARALRILVAEDTRANQKVLKAILGRRGHAVEVVENGREALERLQKADFDVVVMDAQMPTMNGLQATAAIRRIPNADRASVPIIAMTAHAMREDRERCLGSGMDDYLPKPVDATELVRVVELHADRWLSKRAEQAAATPR